MYNLLVTGNAGGWNGEPFEIELGRVVREHTAAALTKRFGALDEAAVNELTSFPTLFAFKNTYQKPARIGWLTRVRHRNKTIQVEYEFDTVLLEVPADEILKHKWDLDVTDWEMNRTHWAVKDVDLFPVLMEAGVLDPELVRSLPPDSKSVTLGLERTVADIEARPTVFRIPNTAHEPDLVSVMMPFEKSFDAVYAALKEACTAAELRSDRADNIWENSEIIQDIFSLIYRSQFVICDFTGTNPNVFYETGIAHTLGRVVIPIAQNPNDIPFDLRHHRFIRYQDNAEGHTALARSVGKRLQALRRK